MKIVIAGLEPAPKQNDKTNKRWNEIFKINSTKPRGSRNGKKERNDNPKRPIQNKKGKIK